MIVYNYVILFATNMSRIYVYIKHCVCRVCENMQIININTIIKFNEIYQTILSSIIKQINNYIIWLLLLDLWINLFYMFQFSCTYDHYT